MFTIESRSRFTDETIRSSAGWYDPPMYGLSASVLAERVFSQSNTLAPGAPTVPGEMAFVSKTSPYL
jgi:hypothetical protein